MLIGHVDRYCRGPCTYDEDTQQKNHLADMIGMMRSLYVVDDVFFKNTSKTIMYETYLLKIIFKLEGELLLAVPQRARKF